MFDVWIVIALVINQRLICTNKVDWGTSTLCYDLIKL